MSIGSKAVTALGATLAVLGPAHFVVPDAFESITAPAFPDDTATWIQRNGAIETALGVTLLVKKTRTLGVIGLVAYGAHLGYHAATAQQN
ncbi:hypothetical protein [Williamsia sp. CHRR-6]|uniref:hypothetical protein n=1 Tax=Williamsia sp. CHRR-6 TaxID=2835871 RepID=UPI001BD979C8|nr:hypothetical protein [Williamsia sp. CHRR-6]MBT0567508.1 hypothetical protein [Williamsia sp. CHRR-6]